MKNLFFTGAALIGLTIAADAASFYSQSLLNDNVTSVLATNVVCPTNLLSKDRFASGARAYPTNVYLLEYTNKASFYSSGTLIPGVKMTVVGTNISVAGSVTNSTAAGNTVYGPVVSGVQAVERDPYNVFKDVTLWQDNSQAPFPLTPGAAAGVVTNVANANICIELFTPNAAANSAVTFRFSLLPDGVHETTTGDGAGDFTLAFTPTALTGARQCKSFPVPMSLLTGVRTLRLMSVDNADTDASSAVWITAITLNTWH